MCGGGGEGWYWVVVGGKRWEVRKEERERNGKGGRKEEDLYLNLRTLN